MSLRSVLSRPWFSHLLNGIIDTYQAQSRNSAVINLVIIIVLAN